METTILTTKPSKEVIFISIIGTLFFGAFTYGLISNKWNVDSDTNFDMGMVIMWIITLAFIFFTFGCFSLLIFIKTICLTDQNLIIKRPLLLYKQIIPLKQIKRISEQDYKVNPSNRGVRLNVYNGFQCNIELLSGKIIKFNSFEIPEYYELKYHIQNGIKKRDIKQMMNQPEFKIKVNLIGWIVFMALLTFGLIYSMING